MPHNSSLIVREGDTWKVRAQELRTQELKQNPRASGAFLIAAFLSSCVFTCKAGTPTPQLQRSKLKAQKLLKRPFEILDAHSMSGSHWHNDFIGESVSNGHQIFFGARKIHFIGGNHPGPLTESWVVQVKFAP